MLGSFDAFPECSSSVREGDRFCGVCGISADSASVFGGLGRFAVLTLDTSSPPFGIGLFLTVVAFAFAIYGWHACLASRPLVHDPLSKT